MKRFSWFILFVVGLNVLAHAQTTDTSGLQPKKINPSKQAARQLKMLQQQLNLTDDQVLQLQVILIHRDVALDSIRRSTQPAGGNDASPSGDARSAGRARREINREADQKINALLTDDQKPLYRQWKQQQREKLMEKRQMDGQNQPTS